MTTVVLLTVVVMAIAMVGMAVGVLFSNKCLRGSCGGPEVIGPDGESRSCDTCPLREGTEAS